MRLDKFLKVSRIIKRRTLANEACAAGRVKLNGKEAKPGAEIKQGDIVEIRFGSGVTKVRIEAAVESVKKEDAGGMYTVLASD